MCAAYYNENDPRAVLWLEELIKEGAIAPGVVDARSIVDVDPSDLRGFNQVHMFAGIGTWSYSARLAGIGDDEPFWTGSCPCQPFSISGNDGGTEDERHLWPEWFRLITACRPARLWGEQVSSHQSIGHVSRARGKANVAGDGRPWFDHVSDDLEDARYAIGAVAAPACSVGAPHKRERLYFAAISLEHADHAGSQGRGLRGNGGRERFARPSGLDDRLADHGGGGCQVEIQQHSSGGSQVGHGQADTIGVRGVPHRTAETNGFWGDADWINGRDQRWRAVEPGALPLVDGTTESLGRDGTPSPQNVHSTTEGRVTRLRGYGNGIVAQQAAAFIWSTL